MQEAAPVVHRSAPRRPHAVVIGSGFGGLAAAIRLGARGYRVTVLERLDGPGGRAYVHRRDGYTFDAGPTIVTAPFLFEELWALCGKRFADDVELKAMDPFYRIRFHDGSHIDCYADSERMRQEVARVSAGDLAGYDRFMAHSRSLCEKGFEELGDQPFGRVADMARVLLFGPLYGLLAAVAISVIGLTFRSSRVTIDPLGKIPGEKAGWGAIVDHPDREQADGILVLRVNAPMFWANAARMHDLVLQEVDDSPGIRALVLDLEATSQLDSTSIDALHALLDQLQADDVELFIARLHYTARVVLDNSGFTDLLGEGHMWHSISQSVKAAKKSVKETRTDG